MSNELSLFNLYIKSNHPSFISNGDEPVAFCGNNKCENCSIENACKDVTLFVPKLSLDEFKAISEANPEYLV